MRSLFGGMWVRSFKIGVVRSLFGDVGVRSFKIRVVESDSEARPRNRCFGVLGCDSEARPRNQETVVQFNDVIQA